MPRPCAQSISASISSSLTPFSATALIFTAKPGRLRGVDALHHLGEIAPAGDGAGICAASSVSSDTLMRCTPQRREFAGVARELRAVGRQRQLVERARAEMARERAGTSS